MSDSEIKTAYLDHNIVVANPLDDHPDESEALTDLFKLDDDGRVNLVTSKVSHDEIDGYDGKKGLEGENRPKVERSYYLLKKVPSIEYNKLLGFNNQWGRSGGISYPLIEDDPICLKLCDIGLDKADAHHVMVAISNECDVFVTFDEDTILRYRKEIEKKFPIELMKPSELVNRLR